MLTQNEEKINSNIYESTLCQVAQCILFRYPKIIDPTAPSELKWLQDRCNTINFLIANNASLDELPKFFKLKENRLRHSIFNQTSLSAERKTNLLNEYLVATRIIIKAINTGLLKSKPQPILLSSASSLFGAPNELQKVLDNRGLAELEREYENYIKGLQTELVSNRSKVPQL
jgi:hypothetical protein